MRRLFSSFTSAGDNTSKSAKHVFTRRFHDQSVRLRSSYCALISGRTVVKQVRKVFSEAKATSSFSSSSSSFFGGGEEGEVRGAGGAVSVDPSCNPSIAPSAGGGGGGLWKATEVDEESGSGGENNTREEAAAAAVKKDVPLPTSFASPFPLWDGGGTVKTEEEEEEEASADSAVERMEGLPMEKGGGEVA